MLPDIEIDTYHEGLHENKFVAIIIVAVIFCFAMWKAWPALKANNVFSKNSLYNYGESKELISRGRTKELYGLFGGFATGFIGLTVLIIDTKLLNKDIFGSQDFSLMMGLFGMSFLVSTVALLHTYNKPGSFAYVQNIRYTLMVWLTTMLIAPLPLLLMDWRAADTFKSFFIRYINTLFLGYGVSITAFAIVMYTVHTITLKPRSDQKKRSQILLIAQAAVLINMFLVAIAMHSNMRWLLQVLPYCIVMGLGIWFYPIDKPVYDDDALIDPGDEPGYD